MITDEFISNRWPDADVDEVRHLFLVLMDQIVRSSTTVPPRFPEVMAPVVLEKAKHLPARVQQLREALAGLPDHFLKYQWSADKNQLFGEKYVRIVGDDGHGFGRQYVASTPATPKEYFGTLADFIAAANPDTIKMLIEAYDSLECTKGERDAYRSACEQAGICMTCVVQQPEPYGCPDCLNTGYALGERFVWVKEHPARPSSEGWYRVMHPGDSEYIDGHQIYGFPDYEAWAYWTPAGPDENGSWTCEHDEDGDFIFAYCGPVPVPPPFRP